MSQSNSLKQIIDMLHNIDEKIDRFQVQEISDNSIDNSIFDSLDATTLLSFPNNLRTTATALCELEYASASDVAKMTHKRRAVESGYLNQLVRLGHINKYREGRNVYFSFNGRPDNHEHTS